MNIRIGGDILRIRSLGLLDKLLMDKTTKKNIIWATDAYGNFGARYERDKAIALPLITGRNAGVIKTRAEKAAEQQFERTRQHAEVFTPMRVVQRMNDHADEMWFGYPDVFKKDGQIGFGEKRTWQQYVDLRKLEITCGEAPYLASRYDAETGETVPVKERIGLLDRKLRIVNENTKSEEEWFKWTVRAFEAVYGYEFQGDNLLIARVNLLMTFEEYMRERWQRDPTEKEYRRIANIIVWNLWQMDGLTGTVPYNRSADKKRTLCRIYDWHRGGSTEYNTLQNDAEGTKFDLVIGNPPYQDGRRGESKTAMPVYHEFMNAAYTAGTAAELITPARFLFNAGRTPKSWNRKMLDDDHLKVIYYERDGNKIFPNTEIKGGVAITYRDSESVYAPIGTFTIYPEFNTVLSKISALSNGESLSSIGFVATKFNISALVSDYPEYAGHERRMSSNVLSFGCFHSAKESDSDLMIYGVVGGKRTKKYISDKYVDMSDRHIGKFKLIMPKADGCGGFGDTLTMPEILYPESGFTHTFLGMGPFDTAEESESALKYIKTKLARALLGALKVTQDMNADKWRLVPLQDFTPGSDIDWSRPVSEIDRQLYAKYCLTQEEIDFIETHIKEMV